MSLAYSLISIAFQIPFANPTASPVEGADNPNAYGHGTFVVYWMLNWIGMTALGLASENMSMAIGQPWTAMWLIFWVITNVSTSFNALPLAPRFYYWGYAWPLHNSMFFPPSPLSRGAILIFLSCRSQSTDPIRSTFKNRVELRGRLSLLSSLLTRDPTNKTRRYC
jgi:hypothetical protein